MKINLETQPAKLAAFALVAIAFLLIPMHSGVAQTAEPPKTEVQQLKERLQQLEQTVEVLKGQLKGIEDAKKTTDAATGEKVAAPVTTTPTASATTTTAPANATETAPKPAGDDAKGESSFSIYG